MKTAAYQGAGRSAGGIRRRNHQHSIVVVVGNIHFPSCICRHAHGSAQAAAERASRARIENRQRPCAGAGEIDRCLCRGSAVEKHNRAHPRTRRRRREGVVHCTALPGGVRGAKGAGAACDQVEVKAGDSLGADADRIQGEIAADQNDCSLRTTAAAHWLGGRSVGVFHNLCGNRAIQGRGVSGVGVSARKNKDRAGEIECGNAAGGVDWAVALRIAVGPRHGDGDGRAGSGDDVCARILHVDGDGVAGVAAPNDVGAGRHGEDQLRGRAYGAIAVQIDALRSVVLIHRIVRQHQRAAVAARGDGNIADGQGAAGAGSQRACRARGTADQRTGAASGTVQREAGGDAGIVAAAGNGEGEPGIADV